MRNFQRFIWCLAMAGLSGCATFAPRTGYSPSDIAAASVLPGDPVRFWANGDDAAYRRWSEVVLAQRAKTGLPPPATLLALSGGSDKGAFGAGLLDAWSQSGGRPPFDIVTGVSTGALIAPFAFLGESEDKTLKSIYTTIGRKDIYRPRLLAGLLGGASLLDSRPLAALIARHIDPLLLDRVAARHRSGHRLLVMTTQLDAQRGVIWDMGAIAASASPERLALFRKIMLASASIPGAFPPVLINLANKDRKFNEMHVDGGTISGFFTLPRAMLTATATPPSGSAIYIIYDGQLTPTFEVTKPRTFSIGARALSTVLGEADRANVITLRDFARERKIGFALCALQRPTAHDRAPLFDTLHMRELYDEGVKEGSSLTGCLALGDAVPVSTPLH